MPAIPILSRRKAGKRETEFGHDLGAWGKTRLDLDYYRVDDIVDVIPLGDDGQGVGNLPRADRYGFESTSTFNFDPIGWKGAKLDVTVGREWTVGAGSADRRQAADQRRFRIAGSAIQLRHDIPGTPARLERLRPVPALREKLLSDRGLSAARTCPWIAGFYVEDKNVMGMTVRFTVDNIFNGRHLSTATVYTGFRDRAPIAFYREAQPAGRAAVQPVGQGHLLARRRGSAKAASGGAHAQDRSRRHRADQPHRLSAAVRRRRSPGRWYRRLAPAPG